MKKLFAILLAVMLFASMATIASAETTTLTTTVPAATYTLNVPADQKITYGKNYTEIGTVTITDANGFAPGKNVKVTVSYTDFTCEDVTTTIPFYLSGTYSYTYSSAGDKYSTINSGDSMLFKCDTINRLTNALHPDDADYKMTKMEVRISSNDWGKALAGEYTATINFTAEVVAE